MRGKEGGGWIAAKTRWGMEEFPLSLSLSQRFYSIEFPVEKNSQGGKIMESGSKKKINASSVTFYMISTGDGH